MIKVLFASILAVLLAAAPGAAQPTTAVTLRVHNTAGQAVLGTATLSRLSSTGQPVAVFSGPLTASAGFGTVTASIPIAAGTAYVLTLSDPKGNFLVSLPFSSGPFNSSTIAAVSLTLTLSTDTPPALKGVTLQVSLSLVFSLAS